MVSRQFPEHIGGAEPNRIEKRQGGGAEFDDGRLGNGAFGPGTSIRGESDGRIQNGGG